MKRMTNFRSAAIATGNAIDDSAYDTVKIVADNLDAVSAISTVILDGSIQAAAAVINENVALTNADVVTTNQDTIDTAADRVQTGLDRIATNADVVLTNADVASTAQDVIDTNADVVLTHADVVTTNANALSTSNDVVSTNQDSLDTAADLVQTTLDRAATAVDVVSTNADVVTTGNNVTSAQAAQSLAETALDEVEKLYLGAKASDPTTDNDGGVLQEGAWYYNTTSVPKQIRIWNGTAFVEAVFDASGAVISFNGRDGAVSLTASDVNTALGFTTVELTKTNVDALGVDAGTVNGLTVETAVPAGALFTDTDTVYDDTAIQAEVDLNTAKVSNVDHPLVETAVPVGAVFTDTVYDGTNVVKAPSGILPVLDGSNLTNVSSVASIDDLTDVDTSTLAPSTSDVLNWNGSNWVPVAPSSGSEHYSQEATPSAPTLGATWYVPSTSSTYIRVNDGTSDLWLDIGTAGGSNAYNYVTKTTAYTALHLDYIYTDASGGAFTITLPLTPNDNDIVNVFNTDTTNTLTVDGNGKNIILKDTTDTSIEVNTVIKLEFIYDGTQWRIG